MPCSTLVIMPLVRTRLQTCSMGSMPPNCTRQARATELIVEKIAWVKEQTAGRAMTVVGYVLLAGFAISVGTFALLLSLVMVVRALDVWLPDAVFGETHMWAAHGILGVVFLLLGAVLLKTKAKKRPRI